MIKFFRTQRSFQECFRKILRQILQENPSVDSSQKSAYLRVCLPRILPESPSKNPSGKVLPQTSGPDQLTKKLINQKFKKVKLKPKVMKQSRKMIMNQWVTFLLRVILVLIQKAYLFHKKELIFLHLTKSCRIHRKLSSKMAQKKKKKNRKKPPWKKMMIQTAHFLLTKLSEI